jgi:hypothetical protein
MKQPKILLLITALVLVSVACALTGGLGNLVGGAPAKTVTEMWTDVPLMDGMTKVTTDLPLTAKLAIQAFVKAASQGDGGLDFIAYTTSKTPDDVVNYYTVDKMQQAGWDMQDQTGCTSASSLSATSSSDQANSGVGAICFFGKQATDSNQTFLSIFVAPDQAGGKTQVFFIRVEVKVTPTQTGS